MSYRRPVQVLTDLLVENTPSFAKSKGCEFFLIHDVPNCLSLEDVARPEIRTAGLRFNGPLRSASRVRWSSWAKIRSISKTLQAGQVEPDLDVALDVPEGSKVRMFEFSKDSQHVAFIMDGRTSTELWVGDVHSGACSKVSTHLNGLLMRPYQWQAGNILVFNRIPATNRGPAPDKPLIPAGPIVKEHMGEKAHPTRTYHDLLVTEHDEKVFEHYVLGEVICFDVETKKEVPLSQEPALYSSMEISPDTCFVLLTRIVRPYSKLLPASRFSSETIVLDLGGTLKDFVNVRQDNVLSRQFALVPTQEDLSTSFDARPRGPRDIEFAWNEPHTIMYVQALDDGEPDVSPSNIQGHRDGLYFVRGPPFESVEPTLVFSGKLRIDSVLFTDNELIVREDWFKNREEVTHRVSKTGSGYVSNVLYTRSSDDSYASRGFPRIEFANETGMWRCRTTLDGSNVLFFGEGASPNGNRPFVDFVNLENGRRDRRWRSPPVEDPKVPEDPSAEVGNLPVTDSSRKCVYERPLDVVFAHTAPLYLKQDSILVISESPTQPPNVYLAPLSDVENKTPLTNFPHPQPSLLGVKKELLRYKRNDGVELNANLYLPAGYNGQQKLPCLFWAYPTEFKDTSHASQVKTSPYRFITTSWHRPTLWLAKGWAVLDNFSVPVVGVGDAEPNDTFVEQLISSAEAAVRECVAKGVCDPDRLAVGGHSYGAFMTAHLLAHTRLFKAGIGRSGAYNRTLTPFSYQAEERTFWQVPDVYMRNSPFTHADKIKDPLLLIHGSDDSNPGTHSLQTERLFGALQGLGKKARMVMLPHERHSYDALESVLHVVDEQDRFLEEHVLGNVAGETAARDAKRARI